MTSALLRDGGIHGLKYDPYYLETGLEVGMYYEDIAFLTASVGRPSTQFTFQSDPSFTTRLEITPTSGKFGLMFGGSYSNSKQRTNTFPASYNNSNLYGGFIGIGYDRFSLLAEYDIADNYIAEDITSSALMLKAAFLIQVGLEAIVRYDRFDPDNNIDKDDLGPFNCWFGIFPIQLRGNPTAVQVSP